MCPGGEKPDQTSQAIANAIAAARIKKAEPPPAVDASTRVNQPAPDNAVAATPAAPTAEPPPPIRPSAPSALPQRRAPTRAVTTGGGQVGGDRLQQAGGVDRTTGGKGIDRKTIDANSLATMSFDQAEAELRNQLKGVDPYDYISLHYLPLRSGVDQLVSRSGYDRSQMARFALLNMISLENVVKNGCSGYAPYEPSGDYNTDRARIGNGTVVVLTELGSIFMVDSESIVRNGVGGKGALMWRPAELRVQQGGSLRGSREMNHGTYLYVDKGASVTDGIVEGKNFSYDVDDPFVSMETIPYKMYILSNNLASIRNVVTAVDQASSRAAQASIRSPR